MNPDELTETKAELEAFVEDDFASLPRADQRGKGSLYLRGLMLDDVGGVRGWMVPHR